MWLGAHWSLQTFSDLLRFAPGPYPAYTQSPRSVKTSSAKAGLGGWEEGCGCRGRRWQGGAVAGRHPGPGPVWRWELKGPFFCCCPWRMHLGLRRTSRQEVCRSCPRTARRRNKWTGLWAPLQSPRCSLPTGLPSKARRPAGKEGPGPVPVGKLAPPPHPTPRRTPRLL